jgi:hypothetical protein
MSHSSKSVLLFYSQNSFSFRFCVEVVRHESPAVIPQQSLYSPSIIWMSTGDLKYLGSFFLCPTTSFVIQFYLQSVLAHSENCVKTYRMTFTISVVDSTVFSETSHCQESINVQTMYKRHSNSGVQV